MHYEYRSKRDFILQSDLYSKNFRVRYKKSLRTEHIIRRMKSLFCRYERLLRRAKTEDLTEVSGIGCLYQSGVDRQGRPVVVFVGKWFPASKINLDKVKTFACPENQCCYGLHKKSAAQQRYSRNVVIPPVEFPKWKFGREIQFRQNGVESV